MKYFFSEILGTDGKRWKILLMASLALSTLAIGIAKESFATNSRQKAQDEAVKITGAMMNVMHQGELAGVIALEAIPDKKHLYGLGPVEYLQGEILIIDGKAYKSTVVSDSAMKVEETFQVKAPFFVHANVERWQEFTLPGTVSKLEEIEKQIEGLTQNYKSPFAFKVRATAATAKIHVVNLPKGKPVKSPEDSHEGQVDFKLENEKVDIIGFFSKEHRGVFTHHDTNLHAHLINESRDKMGHLDGLTLTKGTAKLYLPVGIMTR
jgi:acetolactate decarboxylase